MQLNSYLQSADNAGNWFNRDWMVKSKLQKCIANDPHRRDPVMQSPYNMGAYLRIRTAGPRCEINRSKKQVIHRQCEL